MYDYHEEHIAGAILSHSHPGDRAYRVMLRRTQRTHQNIDDATAPWSWRRHWARALAAINEVLQSLAARWSAWLTLTPETQS